MIADWPELSSPNIAAFEHIANLTDRSRRNFALARELCSLSIAYAAFKDALMYQPFGIGISIFLSCCGHL